MAFDSKLMPLMPVKGGNESPPTSEDGEAKRLNFPFAWLDDEPYDGKYADDGSSCPP